MNTIQQLWESYAKEVMPRNASAVQKIETRRAFYAGAQAMLNLMARADGRSEAAAVGMIAGWRGELETFVVSVREGRA